MKHKIFNTWISVGTFNQFVDKIFELSEKKASSYVCFANVHMLRVAHEDPEFNRIINNADLLTPDGCALTIYMFLFDGIKQDRVAGMDILPALIEKAAIKNKTVFFYGSTEFVLDKIRDKIKTDYPRVKIVGMYSPPFRNLTKSENDDVIRMINDANPDLLFVSLGCPKQEKWISSHHNQIYSCMLGVGQAFSTFCGLEKRLPPFARKLALEWFYRLLLEPRRLWKRFLISNSWFLWRCFKKIIFRSE